MDFVGDVLDGKYELLRVIGEGGMGTVYEATHLLLGHRVAVKFPHLHLALEPECIARFHREARIAARLGHENIVDVTDMGRTADGVPFVVMEFLDGTSLGEVLDEEGCLSVRRAAVIMVQTLSALQVAHDSGVIHRDVKPNNIVLIERREQPDFVKLLDFGAARLLPRSGATISQLTRSGTVLGTPHYMAPEQAGGDATLTERIDIYSMGVVLYQMLTGAVPYEAANYNALMVLIMTGKFPDPRDVDPTIPEEIAAAIKTAAERLPEDRFPSCDEFRRRLSPFAVPESAPAPAAKREVLVMSDVPGSPPIQEHEYDVVFVGLSSGGLGATPQRGAGFSVFPLDDPARLVEVLERFTPRLIVASTSVDLQAVSDHFPIFRSPVILVDIGSANSELTVREWNAEHAAFTVSEAPLAQLDAEIERLCSGPRPACLSRESIAEVGYVSELSVGARSFRIETDIRAAGAVRIRTMVWSDGVALGQTVNQIEPSGDDYLRELNAAAAQQHRAATADAQSGVYDCQESNKTSD